MNNQAIAVSALSMAQYQSLLIDLRGWTTSLESVAAQLRALRPGWLINPQDVYAFLTTWCQSDYRGAPAALWGRYQEPGIGGSGELTVEREIYLETGDLAAAM